MLIRAMVFSRAACADTERQESTVGKDMGFAVTHLSVNPSSATFTTFVTLGKLFNVYDRSRK